jgi:aspartyl-tRNA(Asn)/glutamyl-tRNA(Gln) amidotransferase subunit C
MKISRKEVTHIAHLARLEFSEAEIEAFTRQLDSILSYFDKLKEVDTTAVEPTTHVLGVRNVFREDAVTASIGQETSLQNAPEGESGCFRVPKVID